jgi:hypothetical protein
MSDEKPVFGEEYQIDENSTNRQEKKETFDDSPIFSPEYQTTIPETEARAPKTQSPESIVEVGQEENTTAIPTTTETLKIEAKKYEEGKPHRVTIRAKIITDEDKDDTG